MVSELIVETCEHSSLSRVLHFILLSLSFYSHSIPSIHILSHSVISYHSSLSTLIFIPFFSLSLLFLTIVHSIFTLFIIELVMDEMCSIPSIHSFTIHPHASLSLHSSFQQPSDLIHFLFIPFHHTHAHIVSLHSSITLHYHFHYHLIISHSSLLPFLFILNPFYHSISLFSLSYTPYYPSLYTLSTQHSRFYPFTIYTIHSTLSSHFIHVLFNTLYYTLFIQFTITQNTLSLSTYYSHLLSYSIPFSILYYSPQSLHLFILFRHSYHHQHSAISHTIYNSLCQSFYSDISLSFFFLSILISYYSFIITYYYSFHTHSISHSFVLFISLSLSNNYHIPFH